MLKKIAAAACLSGALALSVGGVASATTTGVASATTTGGTSAAAPSAAGHGTGGHHLTCTDAPKILARIQSVDAKVAARLPKLQAAEQKATAAGKTKLAGRIQDRINRLDKVQTRTAAISARIAAKCPAGGTPAS